MMPATGAAETLSDFLRRWAWPFDEFDEDIRNEGSAFVFWSLEHGFADGETLVFAFDDDAIDLAPDAAHPQRRLIVKTSEIDALGGPLQAYLRGEMAHSAFIRTHPAARALLAMHHEAQAEAEIAAAEASQAANTDEAERNPDG